MTSAPDPASNMYGPYSPADAPPSGGDARYGAIGQPTWSFAQTVRGTVATLAPWLIFIIGSQLLAAQSAATGQRRLSMAEDIVGGVFAFIITGAVELAFVIAPAYYTVLRHAPGVSVRQGLAALGLRRMPLGRGIAAAVVGFIAIIGFSILYGWLVTVLNLPLRTNSDMLLEQAKYAPISTLALVAGAVLIAPICEEIFFRGYLFAGLLHRMNFWSAALISAFLFALAHGEIGSFAVLFVFGLVLAALRWRIGSIWPGVAVHMANNATAALAIILALSGR